MLNKISIGIYYKVNSIIHNINCVNKMLCTMVFIFCTFYCYNIVFSILLLFIAILLVLLAHLPKKIFINNLLAFKYLFIFLVLIYGIVQKDIVLAFNTCIKIYTIMLSTTILTMTTTTNEITHSLKVIMSPLKLVKVPVNKIAFSISTSLRFIPTIIEQTNKIIKSQTSRGIDFNSKSIKKKLISIRSLIVPLFVITIKNSEILAETLQIRLYNVDYNYNIYVKNSWSIIDIIYISMHILLFLIIIRM